MGLSGVRVKRWGLVERGLNTPSVSVAVGLVKMKKIPL